MDIYDKRIRFAFARVIVLVALAVLTPALSMLVPRPLGESLSHWYGRAGALMTVFGAFAQYQVNGIALMLQGGAFAESWSYFRRYEKIYQVASSGSLTVSILGTIIWGYGDLLLPYLFR